jgi:ribose transport system permease protein
MLGVGLAIGAINANVVTRLGIVSFVATLGMLYVGRGVGLWVTETRATPLPQSFLDFGSYRWMGLPLPVLLAASVIGASQILLTYSRFGRHLVALGHDRAAAERAGINTAVILRWLFMIAGLLASLGALVALGQLGTVSPTFGENREFSAIAVAVIGGTSLFGGKGSFYPGVAIGALLLQSVESGLVMANADPYLYPMVIAIIIFVAVLLDGVRNAIVLKSQRRPIFMEEGLAG